MNNTAGLDRCLSFVNYQLQPTTSTARGERTVSHPRAVTISRQAGCGAVVVAEKLAGYLQTLSPGNAPPWTVFDRNLMEKVLEDHNLPARLAKFLPEDRMNQLQDVVDDVLGVHPPSWTVIQQAAETILRLAELGSVILIGRGANMITARLPDVFHVRLVAPLEQRVEHAHKFYGMGKNEARAFCLREDLGRSRYFRKYFKADINDPLLYHLVINTGMVSYDEAARLIADGASKETHAA